MGRPAIGANGSIYFGSADHNLYAVSSVGKLKWKFATGGQVFGTPAVGRKGVVYFGSADHYLYAINSDGTLKWKFETGDSSDSGPAIGTDGSIYVGSWDGFLYGINREGKLRWKFDTGNDIFASPAIGADGAIYVGSSSWDGKLYAINPDGTLRWTFATDGPILKPPVVGKGGAVYVTTYNAIYGHGLHGTFYAIDSGHQDALSSVHPAAVAVEGGSDSSESSKSMRGWLSYHDGQSGLSFRYPPSMRVIKRSPAEISKLRSYSNFLDNLVSIIDLAEGDDFLMYFSSFDNLKPDELISDYRKNHGSGCGFAYHLPIDGHRALACANCTGVCRWEVHLYEPGRKCEIHVEKPVEMDGLKSVPPLSDGAYEDGDFPLLSIIRTVRCGPSKGHSESAEVGELAPH